MLFIKYLLSKLLNKLKILSDSWVLNTNLIQRLDYPRVVLSVEVLSKMVLPVTNNPFPNKLSIALFPVRIPLVRCAHFLEIIKLQKTVQPGI